MKILSSMENEFVPYQLALRMKFLGFNEPCFGYYESQEEKLVISFNNLPLTEEQSKRPGLYTTDNRNGSLPQWAVAAPTFHRSFRWFRDEHNLKGYVEPVEFLDGTPDTYHWSIFNNCNSGNDQLTHEEAEIACLEKLIEIVERTKT
jgi:hypothetical protein